MRKIYLKSLLLLLVFTALGAIALSQVPEGFNYMAIARDGDNKILPDEPLQVLIEILNESMNTVYDELHDDVTTNADGIFQIVIGQGDPQDGGYVYYFKDIDWTVQPLYVKTTINYKGSWLEMGSAQLFSVPYAMLSKSAYDVINSPVIMNEDTVMIMNSVDVVGNYPVTEEEALFEVKRQDGQTMFAVYNQGVRINIPMVDDVKGAKGGFAIGGFGTNKGSYLQTLFTLNKDSARIYLDKTPDLIKGAKGGFAIGGFDLAGKAEWPIQNYLFVAPDSARIYVKEQLGKGVKGGFAIGGFGGTKADPVVNFLNLLPNNYFIGQEAGLNNMKEASTGTSNIFIGKESGKLNTTGSDNVFLGFQSGFNNNASFNSFIGYQSGKANTSGTYNTFFGYNAGLSNIDGESNVFIGYESGKNNTTGDYNVMIGKNAGLNSSGDNNILIGRDAGMSNAGDDNIVIGVYAGTNLSSGQHNLLIGSSAGLNHTTQEYNVMLGTSAGSHLTTTSGSGSFNTFMGINSGYYIASGIENVFIGTNSGYWIEKGSGNTIVGIDAGRSGTQHDLGYITSNNTMIGDKAGYNTREGDDNVFLGYRSGYSIQSGSGNVFIGKETGSSVNEGTANKLYIDNSNTSTPLIYGDFSANTLRFNGNVGISKDPSYGVDVTGDVNITGNYRVNGAPIVTTTLTTGDLTALGPLSVSPTRQVVGGAAQISIADASTSTKGAVQLSDSYSGSGSSKATTEKALSEGLATKASGAGMTVGSINQAVDGNLVTILSDKINLFYDYSHRLITLTNNYDDGVGYWFRVQITGETAIAENGKLLKGESVNIDTDYLQDFAGFEIYFGDLHGGAGWCSVWLQFLEGRLVGHYIKY